MKSFAVLFALAVFPLPPPPPAAPPRPPRAWQPMQGPKARPKRRYHEKGKVLSTIAAAPYVYIEVSRNKKTLWLAANALPVKKGDVIRFFDNGMVMTNFHSKTLNRTFPSVLFVNSVVVTKEKE